MSPHDFIKCERYDCTMLRSRCIDRQRRAVADCPPNTPGMARMVKGELSLSHCKNCKQGKAIMNGKTTDKGVAELADKLIKAAESNPAKMKIKQCSRCKRHLTIDKFPPRKDRKSGYESYCRECKLEYQRERRERKKARQAQAQAAPHVCPSTEVGPHMIHLNFREYPDLLAGIQEMAYEEMRSVDMQIMFFLRAYQPHRKEG